MSFDWVNNTLGGSGSSVSGDSFANGSMLNYNPNTWALGRPQSAARQYVEVSANFPPQPTRIPAKDAGALLFNLPKYITLGSMTADQGYGLLVQRGGYSGEYPNRGQPAKLHAYQGQTATKYYSSRI